jgi:hypothetical protein
MRLLALMLLVGQLVACAPNPRAAYRPRPDVGVSLLEDGSNLSVYVRHSSGSLLLHASEGGECTHPEARYVLNLSSPPPIEFRPEPYEGFDESLDLFQDGRIILVPLPEDGGAFGVFVNLLSGRRYFFTATLKSSRSHAKIRSLAARWPNITVVAPDDQWSYARLAQFPEFQR